MSDAPDEEQGKLPRFTLGREQKAALRAYAPYVLDDHWKEFAEQVESLIILYLVPKVVRAPAPGTTAEIAARTAAFLDFLLKDPDAGAFVASCLVPGVELEQFANQLEKMKAESERLADLATRATRNERLTAEESKKVFGVDLPKTPPNRAPDEAGNDFIDNLVSVVEAYGGNPTTADFSKLVSMCWRFAGKPIHSDLALQARVKRRVAAH